MAGPEGGRLFRDHGADVIKVESRAFPDQSRVFGGAAMMSSQFVTINRDKRSFGVDLKQPEGLALALQLVAGADVVIENLGPGAMESIGLGRDALRQANPEVVIVSSQLFGDSGPWGWWRGFGTHARSIGGQTWLWRYPGTERDFAENGIFFPDQFSGRLEALAALACVGAARPAPCSGGTGGRRGEQPVRARAPGELGSGIGGHPRQSKPRGQPLGGLPVRGRGRLVRHNRAR